MTVSIPEFDRARILVVGDVMLDQYWFGPTARISPEAPVPVVRVEEQQERPGGAANVAVNLASVGAGTTLLGVCGRDGAADRLQTLLEARQIECHLVRSQSGPTISKLRVLSRNQQLIRLDAEENFEQDFAGLSEQFTTLLGQTDAVILSDYAKGTLAEPQTLIRNARKAGVPVLVDPKSEDFDRYRGATVLTPNLKEFEAAAGASRDDQDLEQRGRALVDRLGLEALLITLSEQGMLLICRDDETLNLFAEAREVYDVTGAGDTVIGLLAAGLACGLGMPAAAALANLGAGLVVGKIGVASVTRSELRLALHGRGKGGRGQVSLEELLVFCAEARQRGERILMTNGCFDILHAGHVGYLEEAKTLGDRLIVAVNDDASVTRLKGVGRPVTPLEDRLAVLAGLAAVDWVVPFSGDTPEELICKVLPDVLFKGGDYEPGQIVGADCVIRNGGEVRVLKFREGRSTSTLIDSLRRQD